MAPIEECEKEEARFDDDRSKRRRIEKGDPSGRSVSLVDVLRILYDHRLDGDRLLSNIDIYCICTCSSQLKDALSDKPPVRLSIKDACRSLNALCHSTQSEKAQLELDRLVYLNCDNDIMCETFVADDVHPSLWCASMPVSITAFRKVVREGKFEMFRELLTNKTFDRKQRLDVTYMTDAVMSGNIALTSYMTRKAWKYNPEDIGRCVIPNTNMLKWVIDNLLYEDDERSFSCAVNCNGLLGNLDALRELHQIAVHRGSERIFFCNPSIRIVQLAATGNHTHVLEWLTTDTEYDIDTDPLVLFEAFHIAIRRGHVSFVQELHSRVPSFFTSNPSAVKSMRDQTTHSDMLACLQHICQLP
eukprot:gene992-1511_t